MSNNYSDCWNSGAASVEVARKVWASDNGPRYARVHYSLRYDDGLDDLSGTGADTSDRAAWALMAGKEIIFCAEIAHDRDHKGNILPANGNTPKVHYGAFPYDIRPEQDAKLIVRRARQAGAKIVQVMNEVWGKHYAPTLSEYERLVWAVIKEAGDEFKIIADWHPNISPALAAACWRLDYHIFPRTGETDEQICRRIAAASEDIRVRGGQPCCLEWVTGRYPAFSMWREAGTARHRKIRKHLALHNNGPIGIWYGGYRGSQRHWTAPGWGNYPLWLCTETQVSPVAVELFGELPPVEPSKTKDHYFRAIDRKADKINGGPHDLRRAQDIRELAEAGLGVGE